MPTIAYYAYYSLQKMDKPAYLRSKFRTKCFSIDETKTNKDAFAYLNLPIWEPLDEV
jgi:hypothetical protein